MSSESTSLKNVVPDESLELSSDQSQIQPSPPLLPRSAWNNKLAFLRVLLKAKRALDRIEKEDNIMN